MKTQHVDDHRLIWIECDMLSESMIVGLCQSKVMPSLYDLMFDKGTFDAILVEGVSACKYLMYVDVFM